MALPRNGHDARARFADFAQPTGYSTLTRIRNAMQAIDSVRAGVSAGNQLVFDGVACQRGDAVQVELAHQVAAV